MLWFYHRILQDKSQIEFLTENKRKLQQQLEEECDQLRKDKIKLTGNNYTCTKRLLLFLIVISLEGELDSIYGELKMLQQSNQSAERKHKQEVGFYFSTSMLNVEIFFLF